MSAANAIMTFLTPILPNFEMQFGRWRDSVDNKFGYYAVLRPAGGGRAELLRTPQFTLTLIGPDNSGGPALHEAADAAINAMRAGSGNDLVFLQPAEPVFVATDDGRPVLEIAISAITH